MYFGNINDIEANRIHQKTNVNFSIFLTNVLSIYHDDHPLFKIETILANHLYKIYPLFYCEEIESSNSNDKILDNKCVICEYNTETVLSFNSHTGYTSTELHCSYKKISNNCWCGIVYDENLMNLSNVKVTLYNSSNKEVTSTNYQGIFYIYSNKNMNGSHIRLEYNELELVI